MQVFRSKIDWWFWGMVIATTGLLLQFLWIEYIKGTMQEYPEHALLYFFNHCIVMVANFKYTLYRDRTALNGLFNII